MKRKEVETMITKYKDNSFMFIDVELKDGHKICLNKKNFALNYEYLFVFGSSYEMKIEYSAIKNISI